MKRSATRLLLAIALLAPLAVSWAAAPMVQKHIFTPGAEAEANKAVAPVPEEKKPTIDPKLKNEIVFTGVVIGPKGKIALCREAKDKNTRLQKREGDTILGLTVKRIEPNYMLLADAEGKEMRFNVFQSDRKRPDAPPPPPVPSPPVPSQPQQAPGPSGNSATGTSAAMQVKGASAQGAQPLPGPTGRQQTPGVPGSGTNASKPMNVQEQQNAARVNAFKQGFEQHKQNMAAGVVNQNLAPPNPFQQAIQKALRP